MEQVASAEPEDGWLTDIDATGNHSRLMNRSGLRQSYERLVCSPLFDDLNRKCSSSSLIVINAKYSEIFNTLL